MDPQRPAVMIFARPRLWLFHTSKSRFCQHPRFLRASPLARKCKLWIGRDCRVLMPFAWHPKYHLASFAASLRSPFDVSPNVPRLFTFAPCLLCARRVFCLPITHFVCHHTLGWPTRKSKMSQTMKLTLCCRVCFQVLITTDLWGRGIDVAQVSACCYPAWPVTNSLKPTSDILSASARRCRW